MAGVSTALYRRYRPDDFAEMIGQDHVTGPLMQALRSGRVNHAYLFSGPRGCGKTTSARILARCLNCAEGPTPTPCGTCDSCVDLARGGSGSLDVVEIDAASHNGVDDARDLRERAAFAPSRDRYKIFILDEAHMVTPQGFNALLKIVEEPPPHIKFIFATTEPDKVIGTIRSRTHHYPFRLVPPDVLGPYLEQLCGAEGIAIGAGVVPLVTRAGGGSVRDSLSVMDQLIAGAENGEVDYERAVALLGFTHATLLDDVVDALATRDGAAIFRVVDHVIATGHEPRRFVEDLLERLRDLVVLAVSGDAADAVLRDVPTDQLDRMRTQAAALGLAELSRAADLANAALTEMAGATSPRLHLELLCARLLVPAADGAGGLAARVDQLERGFASGTPVTAAPAGSAVPVGTATVAGAGPVGVPSVPGAPAGGPRVEPVQSGRRDPQAAARGAAAARAALEATRARSTGPATAAGTGETPEPARGPQPVARVSDDAGTGHPERAWDVARGESSVDGARADESRADEIATDQATTDQATTDQVPADELPDDATSVDPSAGVTGDDVTPVSEVSDSDEPPVSEPPVGDGPDDEPPVDEPLVDVAPDDVAPDDAVPDDVAPDDAVPDDVAPADGRTAGEPAQGAPARAIPADEVKQRLRERWADFMADVRSTESRIELVLRGNAAWDFADGAVLLALRDASALDRLDSLHGRDVLQSAASRAIGAAVRVEVSAPQPEARAPHENSATSPEAGDPEPEPERAARSAADEADAAWLAGTSATRPTGSASTGSTSAGAASSGIPAGSAPDGAASAGATSAGPSVGALPAGAMSADATAAGAISAGALPAGAASGASAGSAVGGAPGAGMTAGATGSTDGPGTEASSAPARPPVKQSAAAIAIAQARQNAGAAAHGTTRRPAPVSAPDYEDFSDDDPDLAASGLVGVPLVKKLLGGQVIEEIVDDA
ncbi:hypothetical protein Slu03_01850 [Sediminihabitans luteus]|nr:hypothetical protein Slu03_01850 [Sediminihabitans luteus]